MWTTWEPLFTLWYQTQVSPTWRQKALCLPAGSYWQRWPMYQQAPPHKTFLASKCTLTWNRTLHVTDQEFATIGHDLDPSPALFRPQSALLKDWRSSGDNLDYPAIPAQKILSKALPDLDTKNGAWNQILRRWSSRFAHQLLWVWWVTSLLLVWIKRTWAFVRERVRFLSWSGLAV